MKYSFATIIALLLSITCIFAEDKVYSSKDEYVLHLGARTYTRAIPKDYEESLKTIDALIRIINGYDELYGSTEQVVLSGLSDVENQLSVIDDSLSDITNLLNSVKNGESSIVNDTVGEVQDKIRGSPKSYSFAYLLNVSAIPGFGDFELAVVPEFLFIGNVFIFGAGIGVNYKPLDDDIKPSIQLTFGLKQ